MRPVVVQNVNIGPLVSAQWWCSLKDRFPTTRFIESRTIDVPTDNFTKFSRNMNAAMVNMRRELEDRLCVEYVRLRVDGIKINRCATVTVSAFR